MTAIIIVKRGKFPWSTSHAPDERTIKAKPANHPRNSIETVSFAWHGRGQRRRHHEGVRLHARGLLQPFRIKGRSSGGGSDLRLSKIGTGRVAKNRLNQRPPKRPR